MYCIDVLPHVTGVWKPLPEGVQGVYAQVLQVLHVAIPYTQGAHWVTQTCHHGAV